MTRTDKTAQLGGERQEPLTAAEQAQADGHYEEYARDVPKSCSCLWQYRRAGNRYVMAGWMPGCPWHSIAGGH